ncbi:MAG: GxxExxY protein [Gemmatimonadaceae bacterium]|nr:GxxExxY protein [Gemmatimonadaceae bacterium]
MDTRIDWDLSNRIIGAAIDIHKALGPGLLEIIYEECLCWKLRTLGVAFDRQKHIPISFEGMTFAGAFRLDLIVEKRIVVEIKSVEQLIPLHKAQLMTYLKMTGLQCGLLINFNSYPLKTGIKRVEIPQ